MKMTSSASERVEKDFQDFCRLPNSLLSAIGCDFLGKPRSARSTLLRKFYFVLITLANFYIFAFMTKALYVMIMSQQFDISLLLRVISGYNYAVFGIAKGMTIIYTMTERRIIFDTLREIYPKTRQEKFKYQVWVYFWPKWILFIIYFYLGAVIFIVVSPVLEGIILYFVSFIKVGWKRAEFGYYKLYEIDYSFNHRSTFSYLLTYCIEVMHAHFTVMFNICGDIWLICFTLQLCMHFDYIARTLENYKPDKKNFSKDQNFIVELVKRHQILLSLVEDLNRAFGTLLFLILMSIGATLCCAGVYTLTQGLGRELLEYVVFLPTVVGQYYLVCYYGQLLIMKSQSVAEASYNNAWYNGSLSYKKSIFIILLRSQREAALNALGLQPICLEAFQMVMGATYRVFALLQETML